MTPFISTSKINDDCYTLTNACKQFFLESERLEKTYQSLQERFKEIKVSLQESHTRLDGKLIELSFTSNYLTAILQHISQGIVFIDLQGIITTYNAAAQKILHIPERDLLFHHFAEFFDDNFFGFSLHDVFAYKKNVASTWISIHRAGQIYEIEIEAIFVIMHDHNHSISYQSSSPIPIQGLLLLIRDITKMHHLQLIASRNDRLKELGAVSAHLAHEIRNPLGGIKGFATILQEELSDRSDLQKMATYIVQGADDLNQLMNYILAYSRPCHLHLETVDMVGLINELCKLLQVDNIWNQNIHLHIDSTSPKISLRVDPLLFKSALLNLFVNAIQAMPNGGDLKVKLSLNDTWVIIAIQDTGIGIASENLPNLFSPFFTTKPSGNGLGLADVHKIIQAHYGCIDVRSTINKGTEFTIKIPLTLGE